MEREIEENIEKEAGVDFQIYNGFGRERDKTRRKKNMNEQKIQGSKK